MWFMYASHELLFFINFTMQVHSRASASRQSLKSSKSSTCLNILRHIGSKLLQRRGGVREFWTAFKFMDLDGSGEVTCDV